MNIKYRDKIYSSEDLPIFIYFKTDKNRKDFINLLQYYKLGTFLKVNCMHSVLAGNTVIKDKRAFIYFKIDEKEEKRTLQRSLFEHNDPDNNAMMCAPNDIDEDTLINWVQSYLDSLD